MTAPTPACPKCALPYMLITGATVVVTFDGSDLATVTTDLADLAEFDADDVICRCPNDDRPEPTPLALDTLRILARRVTERAAPALDVDL